MGGDEGKCAAATAVVAGFVAGLSLASVAWFAFGRKRSAAVDVESTRPQILKGKLSEIDIQNIDKRDGFTQVFNSLTKEFTNDLDLYKLGHLSGKPLERMLDYNVPHGKLNRGLTVVHTARTIASSYGVTDAAKLQQISLDAAMLGWCIEWLQAAFLVSDDLMDSSVTRRGQPCWYRREEVGMIAVNDSLILMTQVDVILHKYFGHDAELFMQLHQIMTETTYQTEMGQMLDLTTQPPQGPIDLDLYTAERHELIVKFKTAFYSFYAPIAFGMICAGVKDKQSLDAALKICIKMGVYFQVQDDYLDCYGTPEQIGKIGTDIQDAKCGWLVVQAMDRASEEQRRVILANYGKDDEKCIEIIKGVYRDLKLEDVYHNYEETVHKEILELIDATIHTVPKKIFHDLLAKIYKRQK
mmetsp:Transcript_4590/g.8658  ORF Transcript_4590/g.8658 Transcript_4590/m.8658 type:complete len:412 (-) Transcript_4590:210-1445(-)